MNPSNTALGHLIELIGNVADAYTCALFTIEPEKKELLLHEHFTLSDNLDIGAKITVGKGPIGLTAQTREPQLIENFNQNTRFLGIYKKNENLKSFIALPVIYGDEIAVLTIDSKQSYQFSIKLQKILSEFAQQIAWCLESQNTETSPSAQPVLQEINSYCRFLAESPDRSSVGNRLTQIPASLIPAEAIARTIVFAGFMQGEFSPDVGFTLAEPIMEMIIAIGMRAGIENLRVSLHDTENREFKKNMVKLKEARKNSLKEMGELKLPNETKNEDKLQGLLAKPEEIE